MQKTNPSQSRMPDKPGDIVRAYLTAMEQRDLTLAQSFLAEGFQMTFPGGVIFSTPEELAEWGRPRYRFVRKSYERFDETPDGSDVVVYCFGTLSGELPDGTPFDNIRFIDRFVVSDSRLKDQKVWNDLAESLS